MGILRTDRVSGLGGANAIKGSVFFDGASTLTVEDSDDFHYDTGDFTIEGWIFATGRDSQMMLLGQWDGAGSVAGSLAWAVQLTNNSNGFLRFLTSSTGTNVVLNQNATSGTVFDNQWHHFAVTRNGNDYKLFTDGVVVASTTDSNAITNGAFPLTIGGSNRLYVSNQASSQTFTGFLSNIRIIKGEALYTAAFTPPTSELTVTSNTVFLGCQSSNILREETGKILSIDKSSTNDSGPIASRFTPNSPVGFSTTTDVGTQFESTFDGVTTFDSQAYMVPPGGNTRERNRGRGLFGGGYTTVPSAAALNTIFLVEIQSLGNSVDFGDLNKAACWGGSMCASSTRGLHAGGTTPTNLASIDFVTIANTGNATDFGNLTSGRGYTSAASNQTRGLIAGGRGGSPVAPLDSIDLVTIATAGDATDFGDLSNVRYGPGALASPTRALIIGGSNSPATPSVYYASIDRVEIATAGDASDFGDLTAGARYHMGCASSTTRGLIGGGTIQPARVNSIEFVTIASDGNSSDFGDLLDDREHPGATSNGTRAIWAGGVSPYRNSIEFVTIATTGNAQDFGDIAQETSYAYASGTSDSHGGLS